MRIPILFVTMMILISGCVTPAVNTFSYIKHDPKMIANEIIVNQPYSQVWDKLVKELSKNPFYIITNIDKESRVIGISFSSQIPSEFVDCGQSHRSYKHGDELENYDYNVADSSTFKYAGDPSGPILYYVNLRRTTSLEGHSNIYFSPVENDLAKTSVTVNTRYILTIEVEGDRYTGNMPTPYMQAQTPNKKGVISFNTNHPTERDLGDGFKISCFADGKLEQDVLQLLQH
jgi:hypothetical protein